MRLEGRGLGWRYGRESWLFREYDISISAGEVVGLIGPSGSGKTTLGRILAGYIRPLAGTVTLDGSPLPQTGYHPVQMIFQHPEQAVNPRWTVSRILQESGALDDALNAALGISPVWLDRRPHELSGGELQRICIARALAPGTRFLIADEITAMLDAISQAQVWQGILHEAEKRRIGILAISHDRRLLERICTRIIEWPQRGSS